MRLYVLVEGKCEQLFVEKLLAPHLADHRVWASAIQIATRRARHRPDQRRKGGMTTYAHLAKDLKRLRGEQASNDVRYSTMIDYYALPNDFPGYAQAVTRAPASAAVEELEAALAADVGDWRFAPYIQLHEFEALLLCDPKALSSYFIGRDVDIEHLAKDIAGLAPEDIDDGPETAPSKRIIRRLPGYERQKPTAAMLAASAIGIEQMRTQCPHFAAWLAKLEALADR